MENENKGNQNKLGPKKRESNLEKSIGKWVAINIVGNGSAYGKINEVQGREITMNPSRVFRFNKEEGCNLYKLVNEDVYLEVSLNGYILEPTNEDTLDYINKKNNEEILNKFNENKKDNSKE